MPVVLNTIVWECDIQTGRLTEAVMTAHTVLALTREPKIDISCHRFVVKAIYWPRNAIWPLCRSDRASA